MKFIEIDNGYFINPQDISYIGMKVSHWEDEKPVSYVVIGLKNKDREFMSADTTVQAFFVRLQRLLDSELALGLVDT